jgi:acetyl esterase
VLLRLQACFVILALLFGARADAARRSWKALRGKIASGAVLGLIDAATWVANRTPPLRAERYRVRIVKNLSYKPGGHPRNRLDVYSPGPEHGPGPHPILIYVHGGGFTALSKGTPHSIALDFARQGYTVFNVDYPLAPEHPFPTAHHDALTAFEWIVKNAARHGGDVGRIVLAGESAGANLVTAITNATTHEMHDPVAQRIFALGVVPRALLPGAGHLQVQDAARYEKKHVGWYAEARIKEVEHALYGNAKLSDSDRELAEPLLFLERQLRLGVKAKRPFPKVFSFVGTKDPIMGDTQRLHEALLASGAVSQMKLYAGQGHAFHLMPWKTATKQAMHDMFEFAAEALTP